MKSKAFEGKTNPFFSLIFPLEVKCEQLAAITNTTNKEV